MTRLPLDPEFGHRASPARQRSAQMLRKQVAGVGISVLLVGASGCNHHLGVEGSECVSKSHPLAIDQISPLGFSAAQALQVAQGTWTAAMHWRDRYADGPIDVEFVPEKGIGELVVSIAYAGGAVRYIESTLDLGDGDQGPDPELHQDICPDHLEVDVVAGLSTAGGAFRESIATPLLAYDPRVANLRVRMPLEELMGTFDIVNRSSTRTDFGPLTVHATISRFGMTGRASTEAEIRGDNWVGHGEFTIASFPGLENPCSLHQIAVPFETAFGSFSAADALALLAERMHPELIWYGTRPVGLTMTPIYEGGRVCAAYIGAATTRGNIEFQVTLQLATADGRVAGRVPVLARTTTAPDGSLASVSVYHDDVVLDGVPIEQFAQKYGQFGVDLSRFEAGAVDFRGTFRRLPEVSSGDLEVLGLIRHGCSGKAGAGCKGTEVVKVASAKWSDPGGALRDR